jgi:hypothetical protein
MTTPHPVRPLTPRQQQIATLAAQGMTCPQIALALTRAGTPIRAGRVRNVVREISQLLPNPDCLGALRHVQLWAAHQAWIQRKTA